jgi:predicted P-loop ATPase
VSGGVRGTFGRKPARKRRASQPAGPPEGPKANGKDHGHWWVDALKNAKNNLHPNVYNAGLTLARDPLFKDLLAYDEMRRCAVTLREVPNQENPCPPGRVDDYAITGIQCCLQHWYPKLGVQIVMQAIDDVAMRRRFHPLKRWLDSLEWDGEPRLDMLLPAYFGAAGSDPDDDTKPSPYLLMIGPMFLMSMVARIFNPGCQADYMLVLEGEQGTLKSSACKILAGEYYSDSLPKLHNGDRVRISMHLRGRWLIEIAELASIDRLEASDLKEFLSQTEEAFTPKYSRTEVVEPRQTVFIGTTNATQYLRDTTGARRFWPVKTGYIDLDALKRDRTQLFAEAVARYRQGEAWWPSAEDEKRHFHAEQASRFSSDEAWESAIRSFLDGELDTLDGVQNTTTVLQVARKALGMDAGRVGTADQRRIIGVLEFLGWQRGPRSGSARPWIRPQSVLR